VLSLSEGREENATERHRSPGPLGRLFSRSLQALISMRLVSLILRPTSPKVREEQEIYVADVTPLNKMLLRPALLGFVGSVAILAGASQPNSPFTLKLPGAWWFGIPASPSGPADRGTGTVALPRRLRRLRRDVVDAAGLVRRDPAGVRG